MHTNNRIKAIFFDLGQTLIELSSLRLCMHDSLEKHLPQLTIDLNKLTYMWGHETHKLYMEHREKNFINAMEINFLTLNTILKTHKINTTDKLTYTIVKDAWQGFVKNNKLYPDTIPTLNKLRKSGYKLGLITDSDLDIANGIIQRHRLTDFFDVKIVSSEIKAYKPSPLLFNEAIKSAKCTSNEGIYVGDSEIDIKGAADAGLTTVIISRNEIPTPQIGIRPDFRIDNLSELSKIVSEIK